MHASWLCLEENKGRDIESCVDIGVRKSIVVRNEENPYEI